MPRQDKCTADLEQRLVYLRARVQVSEKELLALKGAISDLNTALSVLADLQRPAAPSRRRKILEVMGRAHERLPPCEIYARCGKDFAAHTRIDAFRTTLWRLAKAGAVSYSEGLYWLEGDE